MSHDVLALPRRRQVSGGGRGRSVLRLEMRNRQGLRIGRSPFCRRRSDRIILDRPLTTGDSRLPQADGALRDLVRKHGFDEQLDAFRIVATA